MSEEVHLRALLAATLYRATMRAYAAALAREQLAPPTPQEKMQLHQRVEERAAAMPRSAVDAVRGREVDWGVEDLPELEAEVAVFVDEALSRRRAAPS